MSRRDRIFTVLKDTFSPDQLDVQDVSAQHYGHAGWREGGETHMEITISASAFADKSRIEAHRAINEALAEELANGLHALQIRITA